MTNNGNEPAYPKPCDECSHTSPSCVCVAAQPGLTKRELFAAMAMAALCVNERACEQLPPDGIAKDAADQADALLAELAKEQNNEPNS